MANLLVNLTNEDTGNQYWQSPDELITNNFGNEIQQDPDTLIYYIEPPPFRIKYQSIELGSNDPNGSVWTCWYNITSPQTIYTDGTISGDVDLNCDCLGLCWIKPTTNELQPIRKNDIFVFPGSFPNDNQIIQIYSILSGSSYTYYTKSTLPKLNLNDYLIYLGEFYIEDNVSPAILKCIKPFEYQTTLI